MTKTHIDDGEIGLLSTSDLGCLLRGRRGEDLSFDPKRPSKRREHARVIINDEHTPDNAMLLHAFTSLGLNLAIPP